MIRREVPKKGICPAPGRLVVAAIMLWAALLAAVVHSETMFAAGDTDRDALVALYQATDGENWLRNDNWLTDAPIYTWYGVTTDTGGRVVVLDLLENGLSGSIPPELGRLTGLELLSLSHNQLSGSIPPELGNLVNLESLFLDRNQLSGSIPSELGRLTELKWLGLSQNQLSGSIPAELGNLINLEDLYLFSNQLSGGIPLELSNLTNLGIVLVGLGNRLTGCIPESWRNVEMNDLDTFGLSFCAAPSPTVITTVRDVLVALHQTTNGANWLRSDNWLTDAPIYTWYGVTTDDSDRITELSLSENGLSGKIPSELGHLTYLEWLDLGENRLSGVIPPELGNLINLLDLYLSGNQLRGEIPSELSKLTNLQALGLSGNLLTGSIPLELGKLTSLEWLAISNNQLRGEIPSELGKLTKLKGLYLWNNEFSGAIPPELGNITNLEELYLAGNQFSGCVPDTWRSVEENDLDRLDLPFCVATATTSSAISGPLTSIQIFERVSPAIAFIETEISTGSGVLVEGGYLVTNAHVVWPFDAARVVFPDGTAFDQVVVQAWDLLADLAVLGPIGILKKPVALIDGENLPIGSDVYLIGYPGEFEAFPQPAIGRGLLARLREWEPIGITYFQTDAIAIGGQSGGALVSETGDVIGISGFKITEGKFGFVASSADLLPRIRQLIAGEDPSGLSDRPLPIEVRRHRPKLRNYWDDLAFVINEPVGTEVNIELTGDRDGRIYVYDLTGEKLLDLDEEIADAEIGSFTVRSNGPYYLIVRQKVESPTRFTLAVNRRLIPFNDPDRGGQIHVGQSARGNIDFPGDIDHFLLQLEENETVEIVARSALADVVLTVDYLGAVEEQIVQDDDSGGGLFGLDSRIVYRAPHSGSYFVVVRDASRSAPGGYIISVNSADPDASTLPSGSPEFGLAELRSAFDVLLASYQEIDPALMDLSLEELSVLAAEGQFSHLVAFFNLERSQMIVVASGQLSDSEKSSFDRDLNGMAQVILSDPKGNQEENALDQVELLEMSQIGDMSLGIFHETVSEGERQRVETITFRRGNLVASIQSYILRDIQGIVSTEQVARALDSKMIDYLSGE